MNFTLLGVWHCVIETIRLVKEWFFFFFQANDFKSLAFFFFATLLREIDCFCKISYHGQKDTTVIFRPVGLRLLFFLEVSSSGVGLISWSCHLFLIPNEGCVVNAFCYSPVTSPSAFWFHPFCPNHCSCSEWLFHLTFSGGACPLSFALDTGLSLVPSRLLSCSCSVEFLSSLCNRHSLSPVLSLWQTVLGARGLLLGINIGVAIGHSWVCTGMCAGVCL